MSDGPTPTPQPTSPLDSASGAAPPSAPEPWPPWFASFAEKIDGRLAEMGREHARLRDKLPKDPEKKPNGAGESTAREEMLAAMALGELRARLPEKARAKLDKRIADGESFANAKSWAEDLIDNLSEQQSGARDGRTPVPTGIAATAPLTSAPTVRTRRELLELSKKDPVAFERLIDAGLDPSKLRP